MPGEEDLNKEKSSRRMSLQDSDTFIVARNNQNYQVGADNVMGVQDTDLFVVSRVTDGAQKNYKVTGEELKDYASAGINPNPDEVTFEPDIVTGSGTIEDPYVIPTFECNGFGGTAVSDVVIKINDQPAGKTVVFEASTERFEQPVTFVPESGDWEGRVHYTDTPVSDEQVTYTDTLEIGSVYFSVSVDQKTAAIAPIIANVDLTEVEDFSGRYTGKEFPFTTNMAVDGTPIPEFGVKAKFSGTTFDFNVLSSKITAVEPAGVATCETDTIGSTASISMWNQDVEWSTVGVGTGTPSSGSYDWYQAFTGDTSTLSTVAPNTSQTMLWTYEDGIDCSNGLAVAIAPSTLADGTGTCIINKGLGDETAVTSDFVNGGGGVQIPFVEVSGVDTLYNIELVTSTTTYMYLSGIRCNGKLLVDTSKTNPPQNTELTFPSANGFGCFENGDVVGYTPSSEAIGEGDPFYWLKNSTPGGNSINRTLDIPVIPGVSYFRGVTGPGGDQGRTTFFDENGTQYNAVTAGNGGPGYLQTSSRVAKTAATKWVVPPGFVGNVKRVSCSNDANSVERGTVYFSYDGLREVETTDPVAVTLLSKDTSDPFTMIVDAYTWDTATQDKLVKETPYDTKLTLEDDTNLDLLSDVFMTDGASTPATQTPYKLTTTDIESVDTLIYSAGGDNTNAISASGGLATWDNAFNGLIDSVTNANGAQPNIGTTMTWSGLIAIPEGSTVTLVYYKQVNQALTISINNNPISTVVTAGNSDWNTGTVDITAEAGSAITSISIARDSQGSNSAIGLSGIQIDGKYLVDGESIELTFPGDVSTNPDLQYFLPGDVVQDNANFSQLTSLGFSVNAAATFYVSRIRVGNKELVDKNQLSASAVAFDPDTMIDIGTATSNGDNSGSKGSWANGVVSGTNNTNDVLFDFRGGDKQAYIEWSVPVDLDADVEITCTVGAGFDGKIATIYNNKDRTLAILTTPGLKQNTHTPFVADTAEEPFVKVISTGYPDSNTMTVDGGNWVTNIVKDDWSTQGTLINNNPGTAGYSNAFNGITREGESFDASELFSDGNSWYSDGTQNQDGNGTVTGINWEFNSTVELVVWYSDYAGDAATLEINGTSVISGINTSQALNSTCTRNDVTSLLTPGTTAITSLKLGRGSGTANIALYGIYLDGQLLVDIGADPGATNVEYQTNGGQGDIIAVNTDDNTVTITNTGDSDNRFIADNSAGTEFKLSPTVPLSVSTDEAYGTLSIVDNQALVTGLASEEPEFLPITSKDYTIKLPDTFPTGNSPDEDLPRGTSISVIVKASNDSGSSEKESNTFMPADVNPDGAVGPITGSTLTTIEIGSNTNLSALGAGDEMVMVDASDQIATYELQTSTIESQSDLAYRIGYTNPENLGNNNSPPQNTPIASSTINDCTFFVVEPGSDWAQGSDGGNPGWQRYLIIDQGAPMIPFIKFNQNMTGASYSVWVSDTGLEDSWIFDQTFEPTVMTNIYMSKSARYYLLVRNTNGDAVGANTLGSIPGMGFAPIYFTTPDEVGGILLSFESPNEDLKFFRPGDAVQANRFTSKVWSDEEFCTEGANTYSGVYHSTRAFSGELGGEQIWYGGSGNNCRFETGDLFNDVREITISYTRSGNPNPLKVNDEIISLDQTPEGIGKQITLPLPNGFQSLDFDYVNNSTYWGLQWIKLDGNVLIDAGVAPDESVRVTSVMTDTNQMVVDGGKWDTSNRSEVWSVNYKAGTVAYDPTVPDSGFLDPNPATFGFDGDDTTISYSTNNSTWTYLTPDSPITVESTVEFASRNTVDVKINGDDQTYTGGSTNFAVTWRTIEFSGDLTEFALRDQDNAGSTGLAGLKIDGKLLIDGTNDSQVWSSQANAEPAKKANALAFDGDKDTSNQVAHTDGDSDIVFTLSPVPAGETVKIKTRMHNKAGNIICNGTTITDSSNTAVVTECGTTPGTTLTIVQSVNTGAGSQDDSSIFYVEVGGKILVDAGVNDYGETMIKFTPPSGTGTFDSTNGSDTITLTDSNDRWIDNTNRLGTLFFARDNITTLNADNPKHVQLQADIVAAFSEFASKKAARRTSITGAFTKLKDGDALTAEELALVEGTFQAGLDD